MQIPEDPAAWLSIDEAARISGYNPEWLRERARKGKITARKFLDRWLISREGLEEYMRNAEAESASDRRYGPK